MFLQCAHLRNERLRQILIYSLLAFGGEMPINELVLICFGVCLFVCFWLRLLSSMQAAASWIGLTLL